MSYNECRKQHKSKSLNKSLPSVSTIGSFFTIAFRFDIFITPKANVTVTTIGKPSGIAATAKLKKETKGIRFFSSNPHKSIQNYTYLTPIVNISKICRFCIQPRSMIRPKLFKIIQNKFKHADVSKKMFIMSTRVYVCSHY